MILSPTAIVRGTLLGALSTRDIDRAVEHYWRTDDFVHHVPVTEMPALRPDDGPVRRYGLCDRLTARLLYGSPGRPGCLVITTPALGPYDRALRRFLVPPHAHDSSHVTVVTAGRAVFVIVRHDGVQPVLVTAEMKAGAVVLYPAGAPHTFVSDEAFQVASLQARYRQPADRAFAHPATMRLDTLPRVSYEEHRRGCSRPASA